MQMGIEQSTIQSREDKSFVDLCDDEGKSGVFSALKPRSDLDFTEKLWCFCLRE